MPRLKIPEERIEAARQVYLGGKSLREAAKEVGVGYRQVAEASVKGNWTSEKGIKGIGRAKAVALVARAADQRAKSIEKSWQDRLGKVINTASQIAENVTDLLAQQDYSGADFRDLASLLRLLVGALESLERMMPKPGLGGAGESGLQIAGIDAAYAVAIMARMRGEAPPSVPPTQALPFASVQRPTFPEP